MPEFKLRVNRVVKLIKLQPVSEHPHRRGHHDFGTLFTKDKPVIFAIHSYRD